MDDIVFVTADSVRLDHIDSMEFLSSFQTFTGVTGSHYTRPSLASIHSSNYQSVLSSQVIKPTLANVLSEEGYTCLGLSPNPNTDASFGFASGFHRYDSFIEPGNRGNPLRQYLGQFDLLRRVYYRLYPPHAKSEGRPTDREVINQAIEWFNDAESPRFLWVHLMESHRPYGRDEQAISAELDRKAFFSPEKLTRKEQSTIEQTYREALARVDTNVEYLLDGIDADPAFVFTADHGEGLGDEGYYFHQPQLRRVDDVLTKVPVIFDGIPIEKGPLSLLDLAPTIAETAEADVPAEWHGNSLFNGPAEHTITIAPWQGSATVLWQDFEKKLISRNGDISFEIDNERIGANSPDVSEELEQQLRDLGYVDTG